MRVPQWGWVSRDADADLVTRFLILMLYADRLAHYYEKMLQLETMKAMMSTLNPPWVVACLTLDQDADLDGLAITVPGHQMSVMTFHSSAGNTNFVCMIFKALTVFCCPFPRGALAYSSDVFSVSCQDSSPG